MLNSTIASRLRHAMTLRQMTIERLAKVSGYGISTVTAHRCGKRGDPSVQIMLTFAQVLHVRAAWLAFGEGEME